MQWSPWFLLYQIHLNMVVSETRHFFVFIQLLFDDKTSVVYHLWAYFLPISILKDIVDVQFNVDMLIISMCNQCNSRGELPSAVLEKLCLRLMQQRVLFCCNNNELNLVREGLLLTSQQFPVHLQCHYMGTVLFRMRTHG